MKAILLKDFGDTSNFYAADVPTPEIAADEVLVQVKSISINPIDFKTRSGKGIAASIKDQLPVILGWDVSGIVKEAGKEVTAFRTGDEVFGMVGFPKPGKTYSEYVAVLVSELAHKPSNVNHDEAAAAPLAGLTALQALTLHGGVKAGYRVLIHAGSGGVGHYAIQMAKYLGAYVVSTSSAANRDFVLSLGADEHIDYKVVPFEQATHDIDLVLDAIGGDYIDRSLMVMKKGGTIVCLPTGKNESAAEKAAAQGMIGRTMRAKQGPDIQIIAEWLEKAFIRSHVSKTFPLDLMAEAHALLEAGRTAGKITLTVS